MAAEVTQSADHQDRNGRLGNVEMAVGKRLRELRQISGWSQGDVAAKMAARGCTWTQATVWKIETGLRALRVGELPDAAAVFGVSPMTLLSGEEFRDTAEERNAMERTVREQIAAEILAGIQESGTAA